MRVNFYPKKKHTHRRMYILGNKKFFLLFLYFSIQFCNFLPYVKNMFQTKLKLIVNSQTHTQKVKFSYWHPLSLYPIEGEVEKVTVKMLTNY